jgi:hypothetical protein
MPVSRRSKSKKRSNRRMRRVKSRSNVKSRRGRKLRTKSPKDLPYEVVDKIFSYVSDPAKSFRNIRSSRLPALSAIQHTETALMVRQRHLSEACSDVEKAVKKSDHKELLRLGRKIFKLAKGRNETDPFIDRVVFEPYEGKHLERTHYCLFKILDELIRIWFERRWNREVHFNETSVEEIAEFRQLLKDTLKLVPHKPDQYGSFSADLPFGLIRGSPILDTELEEMIRQYYRNMFHLHYEAEREAAARNSNRFLRSISKSFKKLKSKCTFASCRS